MDRNAGFLQRDFCLKSRRQRLHVICPRGQLRSAADTLVFAPFHYLCERRLLGSVGN